MNLNTGFFPPHGYRRKKTTTTTTAYHVPLNNQQHQHVASLQSAHSSVESANGNETFLPSISTAISHNDGHKPYRQNDFANNHLFIAKRKLARVFLGQPTRNLQAASDLIHLFDQHEPKRRSRNMNKHKLQQSFNGRTPPLEQDVHLSVVNLVIKPPSTQVHNPLSETTYPRRSQAINYLPKISRSSTDAINSTVKHNLQSASLHTFTNEVELDELIDNDNLSDEINTTTNPFNSTLLCVKSIIPSVGPPHTNHHLLQHH